MTQYNTLKVKLSNFQLNKLKLGIKNGTEVTLKVSSNAVGDSYDSSANTKLSKTQLHKIGQSGAFLCRLLDHY